MAEVKISALPAVATPAGTDEFAVNQGGTTKKMTLTQLLAGGAAGSFSTVASAGDMTAGSDSLAATLQAKLNAAAGQIRGFTIQTAGVNRWGLRGEATAEGGSNAGTDFELVAYTDAGAEIGDALKITRSTMFALWGGEMGLAATKKLYLDGNGDTYLVESSSDVLDLVAGGVVGLRIKESGSEADITFPSNNDAATPTINFGDEDTGIYESADDVMAFAIAGTARWQMTTDFLQAIVSGGPHMANEVPSATNPVFVPNETDPNTGVGWNAADNLSLIAGGAEAIRAEDPADLATDETSLWLYDEDAGAMVQVTVGADDSGGSGYKYLRIPN